MSCENSVVNESKIIDGNVDLVFEDLKAAWESGIGVPDNDDPVLDVYIDGKPVYVAAHPESI